MESEDIILSVLVISHNQVGLLPRCLDSVLSQRLNVRYEIVVSDDRSTDGTWDLIESYVKRHPGIVRGVKCNSDECDPITRSERCGWNKATAYKHARGDYFVNIDADDYLRSNDIYQVQLDALIANPDCSMCQQRVWQVDDGAPLESGFAWPDHPILKEGVKMGTATIVQNGIQGLNQTYMIRRNREESPAELYGKLYDDTVITLYHLQFGKVIFVDRADYVWVQYKGSISNSDKGDDRLVRYALLPYQHALLISRFRDLFISQPNLPLVHLLKKSVFHKIQMQSITIQYLKQFDGFIFRYYTNGQSGLINKLRLVRILMLYRQIRQGKKKGKGANTALYDLLIGE